MDENKKSKNLDLKNTKNNKLETTTAKPFPEYDKEVEDLNEYIKDESVFNIGLVAPYGAGKSSVIKNYLNKLTPKEKEKICYISVANFQSIINNKKNNPIEETNDIIEDNDSYNIDEQEIERSVLQQIFYQNSSFAVRDSNFSRIGGFKRIYITGGVLLTALVFSVIFIALQFFNFNNPFYILNGTVRNWICWSLFGIDVLIFCFIGIYFSKHKSIKKVKISEVEIEGNDASSIKSFNKNIDEIIYRFQKLKYNIVIIEDLDRFKNHLIFAKLKELCTLLNLNSKRKITFIYAVKDSMFSNEEERSKFFDAIVSIIPSLTSANAYSILGSEVETRIGKDINKYLIDEVSAYIPNRRVVTNIINDYISYERKINNKDKNLLFALMSYKNIKPKEFEKMQLGSGIILKQLNEKKESVKKNLIQHLIKEKEDLQQKLHDIDQKKSDAKFNGMKELIYIFEGVAKEYYNSIKRNGYRFYSLNQQISTFKDLNNVKVLYLYYGNTQNDNVSLKEVEKFYQKPEGYFYEQEKLFSGAFDKEKEEIMVKIHDIDTEIVKISNLNYKELFDETPESFSDFENSIERLLLVNGYINENYPYILSKDSSRLNAEDLKILESINNKQKIEFSADVTDAEAIVYRLNPARFATNNTLNFKLLFCLLKNKNKKFKSHLENFKIFLKEEENSKILVELVSQYDKDEPQVIEFLQMLILFFPSIWTQVYFVYAVENKFNDKLISQVIYPLKSYFEKMNSTTTLSQYLSKTKSYDLNELDISLFNTLSSQYRIIVEDLTRVTRKDLLQHIIDHCSYNFSKSNINYIMESYYSFKHDDIGAKNYECVLTTKNDSLINYVKKHFDEYVHFVYMDDCTYHLSQTIIESILLDDEISLKSKEVIIIKETNSTRFNNDFSSDTFKLLMKNNKLSLNNTEAEYEKLKSVDENLFIDYMNKSKALLNIGQDINKYNNSLKLFILNNVDIKDYYFNISNSSLSILNFDNNVEVSKLLCNNNKFKFEIKAVNNVSNDEVRNLYIKYFSNNFVENINLCDYQTISRLILSNSLKSEDFDFIINNIQTNVLNQAINISGNSLNYLKKINFTVERLKWFLNNYGDENYKLEVLENMRSKISSSEFLSLTKTYIKSETIEKKGSRGFKYQYHKLCNSESSNESNSAS